MNRTGFWLNGGGSVFNKEKTLGATFNAEAFSFEGGGTSMRTQAGIHWKVGARDEFSIQGSYTLRQTFGGCESETAVLFSFQHTFGAPIPWMPDGGAAQGVIFNDLNSNGRQDFGESGIPGMAVTAGQNRALTDKNGVYHLPPIKSGTVAFSAASTTGEQIAFTSPVPDHAKISAGQIKEMSFGATMPVRVDGSVQVRRAGDILRSGEEVTSFGIVAIPAAKRAKDTAPTVERKTASSFTRGDGTFSIYLEPGTYTVKPDGLAANQTAQPAEMTLTVRPGQPVPQPEFVINEKPREIKKSVFRQNVAHQ